MTEQLRENYFLAIRVILLLALEIYIVLSQSVLTGASDKVLLLLALFVGAMAGKELVKKKEKWVFFCVAIILWGVMITKLGMEFLLLGILLCYEIISVLKLGFFWYCVPVVLACVPSEINVYVQLLVTLFLGMIYIQHDFIIDSYRKQTKEDTISEQRLKRNMYEKEHELREEINRGLLLAENQLLEERERLSQTLHDKLGHNINGSIYQLEAIKLLMEKDPATSKKMTQAVIDQLRTGMDEIRAILRKERPKKYKLAMMQLQQLCEECNQKGVAAELITEGKLEEVPEKYLEIILDNAYEAVSNSMKYAKCTKIEIKIYVMNQVIRCSISDNGIGCENIVDGMGLAGMRRRIREVNGILDFDSEVGFTINMLLPR
ncbi:MAG: hypothetical protein IJN54_04390 [Lachnospiraceae bacterium]|nr:hypothetical protein [Lachnospiraceae bacterium]